jgi:hypothetical protein
MHATPLPFQVGDPVQHRGIVVTPLFPRQDPVARYVTLDTGLSRGLTITETSEAGTVPELAVGNPTDDDVLLYDGEELGGAKQNRILDISVLVAARTTLTIPVSCVEQVAGTRSRSRSRRRGTSPTRSSGAGRQPPLPTRPSPEVPRRRPCGPRSTSCPSAWA